VHELQREGQTQLAIRPFLQSRKRGLQPSLTRTHYSAGRVSALLNIPPQTLSVAQKRHLAAFMRFCPGLTNCADLFSSFEPCCAGGVPRD
jgi:hypothetical protein